MMNQKMFLVETTSNKICQHLQKQITIIKEVLLTQVKKKLMFLKINFNLVLLSLGSTNIKTGFRLILKIIQ